MRMRLVITIILFLFCNTSFAITYYVSATGNDANNGTNEATPWRTLSKASSITYAPGDRLLFRRGDSFYGTLNIGQSGTSTNPIIVGAYGTGTTRPILTGWTNLTNFVLVGNNIWEDDFNAGPSSGEWPGFGVGGYIISTVLIQGKLTPMGRWPNTDYRNSISHNQSTRNNLVDTSTTGIPFPAGSLVGGELVYKPAVWLMDRAPITGNSNNTIQYTSPDDYWANFRAPYFIQGAAVLLDAQNEWYYNPNTNKLRIWSVPDPSTLGVKASAVDNVITLFDRQYIIIDSLDIQGGDLMGVNLRNSNNVTVRNCKITHNGRDGVFLDGAVNTLVTNNDISWSGNNGLTARGYSGGLVNNTTVTYNYFHSNGLIPGLGFVNENNHTHADIFNTSFFNYNRCDSSGWAGMKFAGDNTDVMYNHMSNGNIMLHDGGLIYAHSVGTNRRVWGNTCYNADELIYMDDESSGVKIFYNTGYDGYNGIYIHNSADIEIRGNNIFRCAKALFLHHQENLGPQNGFPTTGYQMVNIKVIDNVLFSLQRVQDLNNFNLDYGPVTYTTQNPALSATEIDFKTLGWNWVLDSNMFNRPFMGHGMWQSGAQGYNARFHDDVNTINRIDAGFEPNGKVSNLFSQFTVTGTVGSNLFSNSTFTSNANGVTVASGAAPVTHVTTGGLDGGTVVIGTGTGNARQIEFTPIAVTAGLKYRIRFSAKSSANIGTLHAFLNGYAYHSYHSLKTTRTENEYIFLPTFTGFAYFALKTFENSGNIFIDNFSFQEITATENNIADSVRLETNPNGTSRTVSLDGTYRDARGNTHTNQVILAPYSSVILMKTASAPAGDVTAPTVPTGLIARYANRNFVNLDWNNSTDAVGVTAYDIFVNATLMYTTTESSVTATGLQPNTNYTFTVKARDAAGNSSAASAGVVKATTLLPSKLNYRLYTGNWTLLPNFNELTPTASDTTSNILISVRPSGMIDEFGFVWEGYINIPTAGTYTFETNSDDGSALYFNGVYIPSATRTVNNDGVHGAVSVSSSVSVSAAGYYPISVTFFERYSGESMNVYWSGPGIARQLIPNSAFYQSPNQAPIVNAGVDQEITLPLDSVNLFASGSDPDGTITSYLWEKTFGTGGTIVTPNAVSTKVRGLTAGQYYFRVLVTDNSGASTADTLRVLVNPAPNVPPVANAGTDKNIQLPISTTTLNGSGTDQDGTIVSYLWTKQSGTGGTISSSSTASTGISGLLEGQYIFRLLVTDNSGATAFDDVIVNVTAAPQNILPTVNAGPDQTTTLPLDSVLLSASATDPDGGGSAPIDTVWQGPITITTGGTYTGFYRSTTSAPAISIQTSQPVTITGSVIEGAGERIIDMSGGSRTTIRNNIIRGITPITQWGRAIYNWGGIYCIIENNLIDHTGGMYFQDWQGTGTGDSITIRYNEIYNVDSRFADSTMGGGLENYRQGIMFNQVRVYNSKIEWNKFWNEPEKSRVEDVINMNESGGKSGSPLQIRNNFIRGAYRSSKSDKVDGSGNPAFTGSGFTTDGTTGLQSGWINVTDNQFVSTQNAAMNMWRGTQVKYLRNRLITSGIMPNNGTTSTLFWSGVYMSSNEDGTNEIKDNFIGFQHNRQSPFYPYPGRHDENNEASNVMPHGLNTYWPNTPITLADEANESTVWQNKVNSNGITLGANITSSSSSSLIYAWSRVSGSGGTIQSPSTATTKVKGLTAGIHAFKVVVTDNSGGASSDTVQVTVNNAPNILPTVNAGSDKVITLPVDSVLLLATASDPDGTISSYLWSKVSGTGSTIQNASTANAKVIGLTAGTYFFRVVATDNRGGTSADTLRVLVNPTPNVLPTANAGTDSTIRLPANSLTRTGTGADSDGTVVSYAWSRIAGSGGNITSPLTATTSFTGLPAGTHTFRLTVTDNSGGSGFDDFTIIVRAANVAPVAIVMADTTIKLPLDSLRGIGMGSDLDGATVTFLWSRISGPNTPTFSDATNDTTMIRGMVAGTYKFNFRVTDDEGLSSYDTLTVVVNANVPPIANAGTDKYRVLPVDTVTLGGSGSDPDGTVVAYKWTKVLGPDQYIIGNTNTATTFLSQMTEGAYIFRLTVTDNSGAQSTDDVIIIISPNPADANRAIFRIKGKRRLVETNN